MRKVTVCDACLMATCWYGLFMCEKSQGAGVTELPLSKLRRLNLEHPSYWTREAVAKYTGVKV